MTSPEPAPSPESWVVIEARATHKTSNALKLTFNTGPGEQLAVANQGEGDGKKAKFGTLLGFKNGGSGRHVITFEDGRKLVVRSRPWRWTTVLTTPDGTEIATIRRADTSTALDADGNELLVFTPAPENAVTPDLFSMVVSTPDGELVAYLDIIRRVTGWTVARVIDAAFMEYVWWDQAGRSLPIPILGSRIFLTRPVSDLERDVLLAASADIVIGLNAYFTEMGTVPRAGWPPDPENR